MSRPSALRSTVVNPFFVFLWSVLILDERKEGWGDVKWRFGAVEPVMFAYVYRGHLWSFTVARKPCFVLFDVVV